MILITTALLIIKFFDKYFTDYDREAYLVNYKNICEVVLGKELC